MKRTILIALFSLLPILSFSQNKGVLKFLGIPIDGTEAQFATQLRNKGFQYNTRSESYKGQFNGQNVDVYIHTNHNLVDRVYVAFPTKSEDGILVEFNQLLAQFRKNEKYLDLSMNEEIPKDEDISYEISVNNKRYQACFSYIDPDQDHAIFMNNLLNAFSDLFTDEQMAMLKEYCQKIIDNPEDNVDDLMGKMAEEMQNLGIGQAPNEEVDPMKQLQRFLTVMEKLKSVADGDVWFMIHEHYGRYNIGLYYDNLHNRPHGEDL